MKNFLKGFVFAFNGLVLFFRYERNGRIQLVIAIIVLLACWLLHVSKTEWIILLGCVAIVLSLEMINSAIEKLCNLVHPDVHPVIKAVKDISAGAVLWVSLFSAVVGLIVFLPKVVRLF